MDARATPRHTLRRHPTWRWTVKRRARWTMVLATMSLALSSCLTSAPSESTPGEIDEIDEVAAAALVSSPGTPEADPCPCANPVCRPGCTKVIAPVVESCAGGPECNGGPLPEDPPQECGGDPPCGG